MWRFTIPRSLDQIQRELDSAFQPKRKRIKEQKQKLPEKFESQREGLRAERDQGFDEIMRGARQRGMGFSGIPLEEQAEFTASQFLPAMADLDTQLSEERTTLQSALDDLRTQQLTRAQEIRQKELDRQELRRQHQRELELQREANRGSGGGASAASPTFGGVNLSDLSGSQQNTTTFDDPNFGQLMRLDSPDGSRVFRDPNNNEIVSVTDSSGNSRLTDYGQRLSRSRQLQDRISQESPLGQQFVSNIRSMR